MIDHVVEPQAHIVGQSRRVRAVDDPRLERGEDLREVHDDGARAQLGEDLGLEARGRAELPVLQIVRAGEGRRRGQRFLPVDVPADELHPVLVVELVGDLVATGLVEPFVVLPGRVVAAHGVADELEGGVLADLVVAVGHVAVENAGGRGVEGVVRVDHRGRVEHLDVDPAAGHGLHVVDELRHELAGDGLRGIVGLHPERVLLRGGAAGPGESQEQRAEEARQGLG